MMQKTVLTSQSQTSEYLTGLGEKLVCQERKQRFNWVHFKAEKAKWLVVHEKDTTDEKDLYENDDSTVHPGDVSISSDLLD